MADTSLFQMLADAQSKPRGALADAQAAAGALNSIFGNFRAQKEYNRDQQLRGSLDQQVPGDVMERIFGSPNALPGGLSLSGLKELGGASLLKDPSADIGSTALLLSGGDPAKMKSLMNLASGKKPKFNAATISLYKAMKPSDVGAKSDAAELRALQTNLMKQLSGDLSTADEAIVRGNLDLVNSRLATLAGMGGSFKKTPPAKPKVAAPLVSSGTAPSPAPAQSWSLDQMKELIQSINKSLSQ